MEPYRCARLETGFRRDTLCADLGSALYSAVLAVAQVRATALGIRQGTRLLYRHSQLVAVHAEYAVRLAAGDHWGVVQALEGLSAAHRLHGSQ